MSKKELRTLNYSNNTKAVELYDIASTDQRIILPFRDTDHPSQGPGARGGSWK